MLDKKYKILLVHNFYQKPGGEDTVFYNEKKLLEDNGHKVITYTRDNKEILNMNFFKKLLLPLAVIFNYKTYFDIKKIIKDNDIDVVHVHNTLSLISPSVFYAAINMKVPVVQTLHNFRMQCPNGLFYRDGHICEDCVSRGLGCALKHKCYRNSFLQTVVIVLMIKIHRLTGVYKKINFICLTRFNKKKLLSINNDKIIVDSGKISVKSNFVFNVEKKDKGQSEFLGNRHYYLYIGRYDEVKGIDIALKAFSRMPNKELHVIGSGDDKYIKEYCKYQNIRFIGQLSNDKVLNELSHCNALIYPTRWYEGQPVSIIEAFMNKCPVITSDIGNVNEMIEDGRTGLHFAANSVESLIERINYYERLSINEFKCCSYKEYMNKYSDDISYCRIISIYNALV